MANQAHIDILNQGMDVWNKWREENPYVLVDLNGANLREVNLHGYNLFLAYLQSANLELADLSDADIRKAELGWANLSYAKLRRANLSDANLHWANLSNTDMSTSCLRRTRFSGTELYGADFSRTLMHLTIFVDTDLSVVKGLNLVHHEGPSSIGIDTIVRSKGQISEKFFRGAGVSDTIIEYARYLVCNPIEYQTCFISHASKDQKFAEKLYFDLQDKGVRCWFAPEDMKIGEKIRSRIDESIHVHDKLLLILSEHSVNSQWVEQEVETALERERKEKRTILFPIRLDKAVMEVEYGWPALVRNTRNIGNFVRWKQHEIYHKALFRLLNDLRASESVAWQIPNM